MGAFRAAFLLVVLAAAGGCGNECEPDGAYRYFARRDGAPSTSPSDRRCPREHSGEFEFDSGAESVRIRTDDGKAGTCDFSVSAVDETCHVRLPPTCSVCSADGSCVRFELLVTNAATEELYRGAQTLQNPAEGEESCRADYLISFNRTTAP